MILLDEIDLINQFCCRYAIQEERDRNSREVDEIVPGMASTRNLNLETFL